MTKATVKDRITASLRASRESVFLRKEFDRFGDYRQVSRALATLTQEGTIVRMGYGVYSRARRSSLSGRAVPAADLLSIGFDAMRKLGVKAELGKDMRDLSSGATTQVPMALAIAVDKRVQRKIGFGKRSIVYEKA